jgi:sensor histidine kinase YesM
VLAVCRRYPVETLRQPRSILVHIGAAITFAWVHLFLAGWLSDFVFYHMKMPISIMRNQWRLFALYFVGETLYYVGIAAVYFAYDYGRRYREKERTASELALKASRLEASLSRANLEALRMQLNPHFLFNTLNTVSVLSLKGEKQRVARMLSRLGDLLRLSLENDRQTLSLKEELGFLERYLEIEQVRFRDRLSVSIEVDEAAYDAEVPSLILQPIVENAVKYGFSQTLGPGNVSIDCRVKANMLELEVTDTGPGFPASRAQSPGTGVGLANTRARLEQMYGANYTMETTNRQEGGAVVRIRMPYVRMKTRKHGDDRMSMRQA